MASASLAQVHRAVYKGKPVAVKLLKPRVLDRLNVDLALLYRLRWFIGHGLGVSRIVPVHEFLKEFRQRLLEEVDFENEALNIERFRETHPDDGAVRASAVYWEFERADMLVLEYVAGESLRAWHGTADERRRLAGIIAEDFIRQVFVDNFFHADPHPGNVFLQPDGRVAYLDFGAVGQLEPAARRAVVTLLRSILHNDPESATRAVLDVGGTDARTIDLEDLRLDVDHIIQRYRRRGGARWSDAVLQTAYRHGLRLPRSILLYAKATILNEALVNDLDPAFQVLPAARRMITPIVEREIAQVVGAVRHDLPEVGRLYAQLLRDLPSLLRRYMDHAAE